MCGIVGYVGHRSATDVILDGLQRLEYRGYDSAGLAVLNGHGLEIRRHPGKIRGLETLVRTHPLSGGVGLGHTRWATHGPPSEENAHPHADCSGSLVVVHNGIIENYLSLKERLLAEGHRFRSDTDTEVVAHLIERQLKMGADLLEATTTARRGGRARARSPGARAPAPAPARARVAQTRAGPPTRACSSTGSGCARTRTPGRARTPARAGGRCARRFSRRRRPRPGPAGAPSSSPRGG